MVAGMTSNTDQHDEKRPFRDGERVRNTDTDARGILVSSERTIGGETWKVLLDNDTITVWFADQMEHVNPAAASPTPPSADALDWLQRQDPDLAGRVRALVETREAQRLAAGWIGGMVNHCRRSGHEIVFVFDEEDYAECSTCLYIVKSTSPMSEVFVTLWTESGKEGDEHAHRLPSAPVREPLQARIAKGQGLPYSDLSREQLIDLIRRARRVIHDEFCSGSLTSARDDHSSKCEELRP